MAINDYTRLHFADVLLELMKSRDLDEIRVLDICKMAGTQRGTFYYYFRDKYDLASWIFIKDSNLADDMPYSVESLGASLQRMWDKRMFYTKAFNDHSQNALYEYIQEYDVKYLGERMKKTLNITELTQEQLFMIKYHSYGCLSYTVEWLKGKIPVTAQELAQFEMNSMPPLIRKILFN